MLPEVRMARVIDAIELHRKRKLSCVEAGALLGMSERHFRRLRDAYEAHGAEGIIDRRRGRASGRRAGVDEITWVIEEFRTRYFDFRACRKLWRRAQDGLCPTPVSHFVNLRETEAEREEVVLLAHRPRARKAKALAQPQHGLKPLDRT